MAPRSKQRFEFEAIVLNPHASQTQYRQIESQIRDAIVQRALPAGSRLPSTRNLARVLGVSRNTVLSAYDQLISEGYLEALPGSGTRVSSLPPEAFAFTANPPRDLKQTSAKECLSSTGRKLNQFAEAIASGMTTPTLPFRPHMPAIDEFPREIWNRFANEQARWTTEHLHPSDPQGYPPLRESIAEYMAVSRGVRCTKENVVITSGSQQAMQLVAQVLLEPQERVWVEEPGNLPAVQLLHLLGYRTVPVPLDEHGIDLAQAPREAGPPKLIYVTPGGQWPMAMTMDLNRRLELLSFAHRSQSWVLEDDYNGEFRYSGRPHPALASLDDRGRTIYMGSFSKLLFPGIRLGFLVVPSDLGPTFAYARWLCDRCSPPLIQMVLHRFIESGQFLKHIRQMRSLYVKRQQYLYDMLQRALGHAIDIMLPESGMHLVLHGKTTSIEQQLVEAATRANVEFHAVQIYSQSPKPGQGLILGFAAFNQDDTKQAVERWANAFAIK